MPLLEAKSLRRAYGATIALRDCSFAVRAGSVHALIGENGSGKSTLVKLLSGIIPPDSGQVAIDGKAVGRFSVKQARRSGLATVFQEILVLEDMTVSDNLWIGNNTFLRQVPSRPERQARGAAVLKRLMGDRAPDLRQRLATLDLGTRQAITIARALLLSPRILILDEATAALDIQTRDRLFAAVRDHRTGGGAVIFITHKMDEIAELADEVSVLRDGTIAGTLPASEATPARMMELMTGGTYVHDAGTRTDNAHRKSLAIVEGLKLRPAALSISLDVKSGEILGLASLEGHGADYFAKIMGGVRRPIAGSVSIDGKRLVRRQDFLARRVAYVPRDRKTEGIFPWMSLVDNFSISALARYSRAGVISEDRLRQGFVEDAGKVKLIYSSPRQNITELSGGNQQKIVLARALATAPRMLVLDDPTRGVDLATKEDIYRILQTLREAGTSIVIHSTEIEELVTIADRVAVFKDGAVVDVIERHRLSGRSLIAAMFGRVQ